MSAAPVQAPAHGGLTPEVRAKLADLTKSHMQEAYELGRQAGEAMGYMQGWRRGLVNGLVLATMAAACVAAVLVP